MKHYEYKIVVQNEHNSDRYLHGLYENYAKAASALQGMGGIRYVPKIDFVDPARIINPVDTDYSQYVWSMIPEEEQKRVMNSDAMAEISPDDLMCGGGTYYWLSLMIPRHYAVIDIGGGYGAQSYLFQNHEKYIGVDSFKADFYGYHFEHFKAEGTEWYNLTAGEFISNILPTLKLDLDKTFVICNYVPKWNDEDASELVRKTFRNCYVFYPSN